MLKSDNEEDYRSTLVRSKKGLKINLLYKRFKKTTLDINRLL